MTDLHEREPAWPRLFRISPRAVLLGIAVWVAFAWLVFIAIDLLRVGGIGEQLYRPMWQHLFNDRPVEWTQWIVLGLAILAAGYLAGRLAGTQHQGAATFFFILGVGLTLMLFEDAGDARHTISAYVRDHFGDEVFGLPYRVVSDVPYFAVIAAVPIYAVLRYGRFAWQSPTARPYLVSALGLYALAGGASGVRHLGDLYVSIGATVDRLLFAGRFPVAPGMTQERAHFFVVDGPIEESIELFAATCMLATMLAFAADLRTDRIEPPHESTAATPTVSTPPA